MAEKQILDEQEIEQRVRKVVCNYLQVAPEKVTPDSHFVDDLGADSLDLTELAVAFEDEFDIEVPDSEFGRLTTIAGVVDYVKSQLR